MILPNCGVAKKTWWLFVVDSLFIVAPIVCGGSVFDQCFVILYTVHTLVFQSSH